jgi:hypothetical protein
VAGSTNAGRYDYDPRHGALYMETEAGEPLTGAPVELFVSERETHRIDLDALPAGRHPITDPRSRQLLGILTKRDERTVRDIRRLPAPEPEEKWHAVDQATYDGSPLPVGSLWVIATDAPPDAIEDAVRQTMPAGTIWRNEPLT